MTTKQKNFLEKKFARLQETMDNSLTTLDHNMYTIGAEAALDMMLSNPELADELDESEA